MRILKILVVGLVAVVCLLLVAAALLVILFDPNDYKPQITALLEERTGRSVEIADDIEWSLFPWLAIETGGITIGNHPDFGERPFAVVESLSARVRVWPLLRREVELGLIAVDGIELNLGVDADGNPNWGDLLDAGGQATPGSADGGPADSGLASLEIEGVRISNGLVFWRENEEVVYRISDLTLTTGEIALGNPVDVELGLSALEVATQRSLTLNVETIASLRTGRTQLIELVAEVGVLDAEGTERGTARIRTDGVAIVDGMLIEVGTGTVEGSAIDAPVVSTTLEGSLGWSAIVADLAAGTVQADDVTTSINGISASWQLSASDIQNTPTVGGSVTLAPASAADLFSLGGFALPDELDPASLGDVSGRTDFSAAADGTSEFRNLDIAALGMRMTGTASLDAGSIARASLTVPEFVPTDAFRNLLASYVPEQADPGIVETLALSASIETAIDGTGPMSINDIELMINGASLTADVDIERGAGGSTYSGQASVANVEPELIAAILGEQLASGLDPAAIGTSSGSFRFVYAQSNDTLTLENISARAFGLSARGNTVINALRSAPVARGSAEIDSFDPAALLARLDQPVPETSDPTAFRAAAFSGDFVVDSAHAEFRETTVTLDGTPITGSVRVDDFDSPAYRFDLSAPALDVDRYLPPDTDEAEDGERTAGDIGLESEPLELIALSGNARVGQLRLANLEFQQVEATLDIGSGRASIEPARARLYGGEFDGALAVDTTGEAPSMRLSGQATNLNLEPLVTALTGDSNVRGTGNFDLNLTGMGATVTETLHTAAGTMSFALTDGAIIGFNVGRTICAAYNLREGLPQPGRAADETSFQLIRAAADVSDGIASSSEMLARTSYMDISGSGRMNLPDARLDYDMTAELTAAVPIERCETMNEFVGDSIPFTIEGPISDPDIEPDLRQIVRDRVREEIEDRLRDRLEDRLRDLL